MDVRQFELELRARGGEADVWLVYSEDSYESIVRGAPATTLQRGFWTRGDGSGVRTDCRRVLRRGGDTGEMAQQVGASRYSRGFCKAVDARAACVRLHAIRVESAHR